MLLQLGNADLPASSEDLFGRPGPLIVEIGFGDGQFTAGLAKRNPTWNIIGAEISLASVTRAYKRMRREEVDNVRLYRGQGPFIVRNLATPGALHRVYVNFPDPWPRKRHHKNRLLQTPFFRLLSTRLEDGGRLELTTDHAEYFDFAQEQAAASHCFAIAPGPPPPPTLKTKYAQKWEAEGRSFYHVVFTKTATAEPHPPLIEKVPMQHALMEGSLRSITSFEKQVHRYRGGHVILLDAMRTLGDDNLVFQVLINEQEGEFQQHVLVEARPNDRGVLVSLNRFGDPLSTYGGREAVKAVAQWLEKNGFKLLEQRY